MSAHVIVIGGGIAGLAATEALTRLAPDLRVTLLEASDRLGGCIRTEQVDGFVIEAGPDVLLTAKPGGVELARHAGIAGRLHGTSPDARGSYILDRHGLTRLPNGMTGLVPAQVAPFVTTKLLSPLGKLRVALEYALPPRQKEGDESVEAFVVRRLGREMYDRLTEPLLSGISAADGARLSVAAMFPHLRALESEHGGLIRGMLASRRARPARPDRGAPPAAPFVSLPGGLSELVTAVARAVRDRDPGGERVCIRQRALVANIETRSDTGAFGVDLISGERLSSDALVVATPADVAAWMLRPADHALAGRLGKIEYASSITVSVAYPITAVRRSLDATGYVVPRIRHRPVLACTWSSAKFPGRAPDGYALFRIFLGGAKRPATIGLSDAEVADLVRDEMREVMGIQAEPVLQRIHRFHRAMPQYTVGHLDRVAAIHESAARTPGLTFAGAAYSGVGIPDCIRSAHRAAEGVLRHFAMLPTTDVSVS